MEQIFIPSICRKRVFLLAVFMCFNFISFAQQEKEISGTVTDNTGQPIPGVNVLVEGTNRGAVTDFDGNYSIMATPDNRLVFTFVGFESRTVEVGTQTTIDVTLTPDETALEEVVVVAFGEQKKVSVTGSISSIGGEDLQQSSSASLANALSGRLPGLSAIQTAGGQPGRDDAQMFLRGAATTNGTSPLILIDGVPRDNIRTLSASEIESVSILKDASATAVFGVRGANGVILITTRRGSEGATKLSINAEQSFTSFTFEPERLHSLEYMELRNEAALNDGITTPPFSQEVMDRHANPLAGLDPDDPDYAEKAALRRYMYPDHDYYREFISKYSPQTRVDMNVSGGTEKVKYFANASYLHQGGNLNTEPESVLGYDPSSWMDRYSFRANLDFQVTESLKSFLNIASYIEKVNMPAAWLYGNDTQYMMYDLFYQAQTILPITPGPTTIAGFGVAPGQIVDPGYLDRSAFEIINRMGYRHEVRSNLNSTLGLEWDLSKNITEGLNVKGMISYDTRASSAEQGRKREPLYLATVNPETNQLTYATKRPDEELLSITKGTDSRYNINIQASLNYNREFGKHDIGAMVLGQRDHWESTGGEMPYNVQGIAARATYGFDERYLLEANIGYNGSEQFAPSNRYGFFPAGSVGWVVSNENFLEENDVLTNLKLRASYGLVGNDKMGSARFLYLDNITMGGGPLGSLGRGQGVNLGLLGNPSLSWEVAAKQNYGVDLELFDNLSASFDYYFEERTDILISRNMVPSFQGVPLGNIPRVNLGEVDNQGYEIEVTYNKAISEDLYIMFRGNYAENKNVVRFFDEPIRDSTYASRYRITGHPLATNFGYKIDYSNGNGYFNSQQELDEYLEDTSYGFGVPRVGDFKYRDLNDDGVINARDQVPIGSSRIPGIVYGFSTTVQYKGFELTAFFQGVGEYSSNYANQGVYENWKQGTYFGYHRTAWTAERYANGEEITYPALTTRTSTNLVANDFFIMDRSYVRLKNIELAYNLPATALDVLGVQALRVFVGGQNLYTWENLEMDHLDPENNDAIGYPVTKMATVGLNLTF